MQRLAARFGCRSSTAETLLRLHQSSDSKESGRLSYRSCNIYTADHLKPAIVVQLGFYLHMQVSVLGRSAIFNKPLLFATAFMCFFSIVIALAKVFWMCVGLLQTAYAAAIITGLTAPALCTGHAILAGILWERSQSVDLKSRAAITIWYMFIWKLFYAEYFLIPFMR